MEFFDVIHSRYSHKSRFLDTAVPYEHLCKIAQAGLAAPTGSNLQCVHLIILEDKAAIAPLLDISARDRLESVPAAIALFTTSANQGDPNFEMEDYGAAAENILLAAVAMGYASCWLDSPYFGESEQRAACEALGVPEGYHLRVLLPIGLPEDEGSRRAKKPFCERVSRGVYGR